MQKKLHEKGSTKTANRMFSAQKLIDYLIIMSYEAQELGLWLLELELGCPGFEAQNQVMHTPPWLISP